MFFPIFSILQVILSSEPGADLGISQGGGVSDFQKENWNFVDLFFRLTKLIFWALPNHHKDPNLAKFTAPQANLWKNMPQRRFYAFWKFSTKNRVFAARAPPLN